MAEQTNFDQASTLLLLRLRLRLRLLLLLLSLSLFLSVFCAQLNC